MELHTVILTKSKLAALPQAERSLLVLLGHASNEINVLSKLILMVRKDPEFTAAVERAFRAGDESEMAATATYDLRRR